MSDPDQLRQMIEVPIARVQSQVVLEDKAASHMSFVGIGVPCFQSWRNTDA